MSSLFLIFLPAIPLRSPPDISDGVPDSDLPAQIAQAKIAHATPPQATPHPHIQHGNLSRPSRRQPDPHLQGQFPLMSGSNGQLATAVVIGVESP
jgi:hypothetical protein